jgi:hypothetical protein
MKSEEEIIEYLVKNMGYSVTYGCYIADRMEPKDILELYEEVERRKKIIKKFE